MPEVASRCEARIHCVVRLRSPDGETPANKWLEQTQGAVQCEVCSAIRRNWLVMTVLQTTYYVETLSGVRITYGTRPR